MTGSRVPRRETKLRTRLRAGDTDTLLELYDQVAPGVYGLALRITGLQTAAETITTAVFLHLWQHPDDHDQAMSVRSHVGLLAHDYATTWLREHRPDRRLAPPRVQEPIELTDDIRDALETLPADQRIVLETTYFGGNTVTETAAILGSTGPAVAGRLREALRHVSRRLSPAAPHHPSPGSAESPSSTPQLG